jgi:hypothetical protein
MSLREIVMRLRSLLFWNCWSLLLWDLREFVMSLKKVISQETTTVRYYLKYNISYASPHSISKRAMPDM